MQPTTDARERLRMAGQADLGLWVEATGNGLWSIQREIGEAASAYRARVSVPSCTASGKTFLAARLALAFFDSYTPGTPCAQCGPDGCTGAKVITLASKFEHLRDVLWGEIRTAAVMLARRGIPMNGRMGIGQTLRLDDGPDHWLIGVSPAQAESLQGVHGAHILVIGDEATALPEEVTRGLVSSLATGDARMLLIANPTDESTWFYDRTLDPGTTVIKITAWDTPLLTGEPAPEGSFLLTPEYLEEMKAAGFGPGTYDWETKIGANFWSLGDSTLIAPDWYDRAAASLGYAGSRSLGIDLAPYGSAKNAIAVRDGNRLEAVLTFPSMRPDLFWAGPVTDAIRKYAPHVVTYDADGVGAGIIGEAERACQAGTTEDHTVTLVPFRGALSVTTKFLNMRSSQWWELRRRFENSNIAIAPGAHSIELRNQICKLQYKITAQGDIRAETKDDLKKRVRDTALDMGDAVMYAFSFADMPIGDVAPHQPLSDFFGLRDRPQTVKEMIARDKERLLGRGGATLDESWI